jgi:hypothetical protein
MDKNLAQMTSDADDHVARLESRLLQAQEHARVQQNTLNHYLQLLQCIPGTQMPPNPPAALEMQTLVTLADPIPQVQVCSLKPSAPNDFNGDCLWGHAFLNSC